MELVTSRREYTLGQDKIAVEESDTSSGFWQRLIVNGVASPWQGERMDLFMFKGYALASEYWGQNFPLAGTPFKVVPCERA